MKPFIGTMVVVTTPTKRQHTFNTWRLLFTERTMLKAVQRDGREYNAMTHHARRHFFIKRPGGMSITQPSGGVKFVKKYDGTLMVAPEVSYKRLERRLSKPRRFKRWLAGY